ncbi:MAG: transcriptional regulator GcvA, partial [Rhodobacteraceae bacterium]|nr:transcriptional regulator GcvA [Paracoccaceae bacterium]
ELRQRMTLTAAVAPRQKYGHCLARERCRRLWAMKGCACAGQSLRRNHPLASRCDRPHADGGPPIGPEDACPQSIVSLACPRFSHDLPFAMARRLPSLNAVRAFEAAARHESFTRAAEELCVTQGAVSHQVKALEAELGLKLFNRERQRLMITEAGRDYLNVVRDTFDRIAIGTERLLQRQNSGVLTVSTSPDFAAEWLVHRLGRFAEAYPEIELRVSATLHHVDFAREDIDLAVRHGEGHWPGLHVTRLCSEELFPVCSPRLATDARPLNVPADLLGFPLLHLDDRTVWASWLEAAGVGDGGAMHGPVLNRASMVIDAAVDGQGVTLARTTLAAWDLINGRLIRPLALALPLAKSYWIVCPKASASLPKIVTFRDWLLAEAADDAQRIAALEP